jgi:hypothetical protein
LAVDAGRIQSLFSQQLGNMSAVIGCLIAGMATSFWASWIMALTLYSLLPLFALAGILNYKVGQYQWHEFPPSLAPKGALQQTAVGAFL